MTKPAGKHSINIGSRKIGDEHPTFVIAETGTSCLGDIQYAYDLVDVCKTAGVDAIKFQLIDPLQDSDPSATYPVEIDNRVTQVNMLQMFNQLQYTRDEWKKLRGTVSFKDFCSLQPLTTSTVSIFWKCLMPCHKLGAWDATYKPLIQKLGGTKKPLFVDLGPTTKSEIEELTSWYLSAGGNAIIFLHDFHTNEVSEMNMRAISYLRDTSNWPVGYSSPAHDHDLDILAIGLGASVIEKRLTLDKTKVAFHSQESLSPTNSSDGRNVYAI